MKATLFDIEFNMIQTAFLPAWICHNHTWNHNIIPASSKHLSVWLNMILTCKATADAEWESSNKL